MEVLALTVVAMVIAHLFWRVKRLEDTVALLEQTQDAWSHQTMFEAERDAGPEPELQPQPEPEPDPTWEVRAERHAEEPAPQPEPVVLAEELPVAPLDVVEPEPQGGFGFEDIFGRRLPIWLGGITLAVAGMLIVKYSIDAGLVSPLVRVISGLLFGTGLIAAAELALLRADARIRDPRVRQALAGAGVASL
jgi:uncharacterized membrane protein